MRKILLQCKVIVSLLLFLMLFTAVQSATITSTSNGGDWSKKQTWIGSVVPLSGDAVVIATSPGKTVIISGNVTQSAAGSVTVNTGAVLTASTVRGGSVTFGVLTVNSGGSVIMNRPLIVLGGTSISGAISFGSTSTTSRSMLFNGNVILNSGATWTEPASGNGANNTYNFAGNFTNNATTFTAAGTGIHTFSGTGMTIAGNTVTAISNVTITGTRTNSGILSVSTTLAGAGTLTNAATGIINYGGMGTIVPTINASSIGNTVNYSGAAQTAKVTSYYNLTLSGSGTKTFASAPTVNGKLSLEGTASVVVTNGVVSYGPSAVLQYNKSGAYTATAEEWITPFTATGGVLITNTGTITVPSARTIGSGSLLHLQNGVLAAGLNLSMASTSAINRSEGSITGTLQGTGIYNVNYSGSAKITGAELSGSGLYDIAVSLTTAAATLTSSTNAFTVDNNLTVSQGNLILQASNDNYTVSNNLVVSVNGTLTHSVYWDGTGKLLRVNGNISIDGKFAYSVRSHVQMGGVNKSIRTGPAPSALSILTLVHTSGTISASGLVTVDDNFWASFNTAGGTFATANYTVFAKSALLNAGGVVNLNGGTLNVVGGLRVGFQDLNGSFLLNTGTLNTDFISVGDGTRTGTFAQSGGIANISGNLVINPSCSYTCTNSPTINISGNFINNGIYSKGAETVTFSGITPATLSGASNTVMNNLSITNTGGVTTQLGLLTTNAFTISSGSKFTIEPQKFVTVNGALTLNDSIILKSTSAGTASLVTNGPLTGSKARIERYLNGISWAWHFLSSPVSAQAISSGFTPATSGYDFYTWYEPQLLWVNVKTASTSPNWNTANGNTNFSPGRGYLVAYEAINTIKSFRGEINNGTVSFPLTRGGTSTYQYYNLAGNPYPCSIDWEATSGWDRSNLSGTQKSYWIWNDAKGNYGAYITGGSGINGATRYISGGQGFMVQAATVGDLTMSNSVKVHSAQAYLKTEETIFEELRLSLSCDANSFSDETIIALNNSNNDDGAEKFNSMYTNAPEIWSVKNGQNFSINFLDDLSTDIPVPISVKAGVAGTYTLKAGQMESFGNDPVIILEDRVAGTFTNLVAHPDFVFQVNNPGLITDRFFLHFMNIASVPRTEVETRFTMRVIDGAITITSNLQEIGKIVVFDMLGRIITTDRIKPGATTHINLHGKTGVYIVSVNTNGKISSAKLLVK